MILIIYKCLQTIYPIAFSCMGANDRHPETAAMGARQPSR